MTSALKAALVHQDIVFCVLMRCFPYTVRGWGPSQLLPPLSGITGGNNVLHKQLALEQQLLP